MSTTILVTGSASDQVLAVDLFPQAVGWAPSDEPMSDGVYMVSIYNSTGWTAPDNSTLIIMGDASRAGREHLHQMVGRSHRVRDRSAIARDDEVVDLQLQVSAAEARADRLQMATEELVACWGVGYKEDHKLISALKPLLEELREALDPEFEKTNAGKRMNLGRLRKDVEILRDILVDVQHDPTRVNDIIWRLDSALFEIWTLRKRVEDFEALEDLSSAERQWRKLGREIHDLRGDQLRLAGCVSRLLAVLQRFYDQALRIGNDVPDELVLKFHSPKYDFTLEQDIREYRAVVTAYDDLARTLGKSRPTTLGVQAVEQPQPEEPSDHEAYGAMMYRALRESENT